MHQSVIDIFPSFTNRFEGRVPWMYLDIKGLVTIGLGCLIDPIGTAESLNFVERISKKPATKQAIINEWKSVKARTDLARKGHRAARSVTALELPEHEIDRLARERLNRNADYLKKTFPDFGAWPADAQLATLSMAWAMGAGFSKTFKLWTAAAKAHNWIECANQCRINDKGNPGVTPRNKANFDLFKAASATKSPELVTGWEPF